MKLLKRSVELIVIRDIFNPTNNMQRLQGVDVEQLLRSAFGDRLPNGVKLYHGDFSHEVTPKTKADVDRLLSLDGKIIAACVPRDPITVSIVSSLVSIAVSFALMPSMPATAANAPPSPNNALAARTNKHRLGGRIPDILGTVWSVPDLISTTYTFYDDHKEVEVSHFCVGRGQYHVSEALDDTTPIAQVFGSSVMVFNPNKTFDDIPDFTFGSTLTPDEAAWSTMTTKRYTSVNGQTLNSPDSYIKVATTFRNPNIIETTDNINFLDNFKVGDSILIEGADNLASGNGIVTGEPDPKAVTYTLNGQYQVLEVTAKQIKIFSPASINSDWQKLANNVDFTVQSESVALSAEADALWQGWFYTDLKDHDSAYVNIVAPNGLYEMGTDPDWAGLRVYGVIESEVVDDSNVPIFGTFVSQGFNISAPFSGNNWQPQAGGYDKTSGWSRNDKVRSSAAATINIENPNFTEGKRLRFRIARTSNAITGDGSVADEIKIKDFYGARKLSVNDYPKGVTLALSKTRGTEGALSIKERKLRLLVQRYVSDAATGNLVLSNRADDIFRHAAMDAKIGNLTLPQIDVAQIKAEVDAVIAYFGTPLCAEFSYTFDDDNLSSEETLQLIASAVFCVAERRNNKVMLGFERKSPASMAIFNSHNIMPNTFKAGRSYGVVNDHDGARVEYVDPIDDAVVTLSYPYEGLSNPHEEKLTGVRNKIQAWMHLKRRYNLDLYSNRTCEFVGGDESNIVLRTNRITVANQRRADIQQGSVDSIGVIGNDIVMHVYGDATLEAGVQYTAFIQTINNGVEAIPVMARDDYSVTLSRLPSGEISTNSEGNAVQAVYQIVKFNDTVRHAYRVTKKSPSEGMSNTLTCINYDDRFYDGDTDYKNGLVALN